MVGEIPPTSRWFDQSQWLLSFIDDQLDLLRWKSWHWPVEPKPDFLFDSDIQLVALIGAGQFGQVYLARFRRERWVAVKFMRASMIQDHKDVVRNILRERFTCRVIDAQSLPFTARYVGFIDDVAHGLRGLVFDLCADISDVEAEALGIVESGFVPPNETDLTMLPNWTDKVVSSLRHAVVFAPRKPPVSQIVRMLRDVAVSLNEVHKLGFIHCDIAARNILCDKEMNVKLADFGLAKYVGSEANHASKMARYYSCHSEGHQYAIAWWAPECFGSGAEDVDDAIFSTSSDVYSFGVLMWQCLAGRDPFDDTMPKSLEDVDPARDTAKLIRRIRDERETPNIDQVRRDAPDELVALIKDCWNADPEDRPTFHLIIERLEQIALLPSKPARPPGVRNPRQAKKNWDAKHLYRVARLDDLKPKNSQEAKNKAASAKQEREQELQNQHEDELAQIRLQLEELARREDASTKVNSCEKRVAAANGRNVLTVLFSDPLVYKDTDNNLRPFAKLGFDMERALIKQCLMEAGRDIDLFFDSATGHRLLTAKALRPNCLHFSGHGDKTHLPFENGKGGTHWLDACRLGDLIAKDQGQPFKFVFVSACHSRKAGEVFVAVGVPHVVCCQEESEIKDVAARNFTRQFYLSLAAGHTVKDSFQEGCNAVLVTPGLVDASEEMKKFVLLPEDGKHDVSIFDAKEVKEWSPSTRASDNLIQDNLSYPPPLSFVGREIDMYHVVNLVLTKQLVSIVGEKGVGRKSLAYAVCHYINERRSTMLPMIDSIFIATDSNGFLRVLQDLQRHLMTLGGETVHDDMDFLIDSICDSISKKALLVIDGTDYVKDSAEHQGLVRFLRKLREKRGTKVLLIGLEPLRHPTLPEQDFMLSSLDFDSTVRLFCNLCPRLDTAVKRKVYREKLVSATEDWYRLGDVRRVESLYLALGGGIPGKTVEKAGEELSRTKIDEILSGRAAGPPMQVQTEEEPSRKGLRDVREERTNISGDTPLHSASRMGQEAMVLTLTEHANPDVVNATNNVGRTPLHEACSYGREVIASILLRGGAVVDAQSGSRRNPLHLACAQGHVSIMALLLNNGADIDAQDNFGNTPLHEAYRWHGRESDVVNLLLQRDADPNMMNNDNDVAVPDGYEADLVFRPLQD